MTGPCRDCTERTVEPNCHDTCRRYIVYKMVSGMARQRKIDRIQADSVALERAKDWKRRTHAMGTLQSAKRARNRK